ncbi:CRAL/TRIO domain protein, partial [Teladorsagia circumcincta]
VTAEYAPVSIIGPNRKNGDRLIVVDQSGRIDIGGVMKSIQPTEYLHQLFRNFEKILALLNEMEANTGVQCSVYYVFDLDGLKFDPSLLGIISGPFRVSWQLIGQHYREFINRFVVVNTPSYINVLWSAISPFVPENARNRVAITGKEWRQEILELADRDCLPERYGGEIPDEKVLR